MLGVSAACLAVLVLAQLLGAEDGSCAKEAAKAECGAAKEGGRYSRKTVLVTGGSGEAGSTVQYSTVQQEDRAGHRGVR